MIIETTKNDCSVEPFTVDWADVYQQLGLDGAVNPITSSGWVGVDVTVDSDAFTGLLASAIISGGVIGAPATLSNTVVVASLGLTFCQKFAITIE